MYDVLSLCLAPTFQHTLVFDTILLGAVNRARLSFFDASGKGVNACRAAVRSGGSALHITHVGGPLQKLFKTLCQEENIALRVVPSAGGIRTCTTIIDQSTAKATELVEECPAIEKSVWPKIFRCFRESLPKARSVLLSGKPAAGYPDDLAASIAMACREAMVPLVIDARGKDLLAALPYSPAICKPNAEEFLATFSSEKNPDIEKLALEFSKQYACPLLLTRGGQPTIYANAGTLKLLPIRQISVQNPIGSGDACAAGICLGISQGLPLEEAITYGLELGSRNAESLRPGWV